MKRETIIKQLYKKHHEKYPDKYTLDKYLGNSIDITNYYEIRLYITRLELLISQAYNNNSELIEIFIPKILGINTEKKIRLYKDMKFDDTWLIESNKSKLDYALRFRLKIMKRRMRKKI
jgi:hypothetical protein